MASNRRMLPILRHSVMNLKSRNFALRGGQGHDMRPFVMLPRTPPGDDLLPEDDFMWDDPYSPEFAMDFDASHVPRATALKHLGMWFAGLAGFFGLVMFSDPESKSPTGRIPIKPSHRFNMVTWNESEPRELDRFIEDDYYSRSFSSEFNTKLPKIKLEPKVAAAKEALDAEKRRNIMTFSEWKECENKREDMDINKALKDAKYLGAAFRF